MNSREKGKRGEREFAAYLTRRGFTARRGVQFAGGPDSPDVRCRSLGHLHFEVKRTEKLRLAQAYEQAMKESAPDQIPVVAHRRNRGEWMVTLSAGNFLKLAEPKWRNE